MAGFSAVWRRLVFRSPEKSIHAWPVHVDIMSGSSWLRRYDKPYIFSGSVHENVLKNGLGPMTRSDAEQTLAVSSVDTILPAIPNGPDVNDNGTHTWSATSHVTSRCFEQSSNAYIGQYSRLTLPRSGHAKGRLEAANRSDSSHEFASVQYSHLAQHFVYSML